MNNRADTDWGYRVLRRVQVPQRRVNWWTVIAWSAVIVAWWIMTGRGLDALILAGGGR